MEGRSSSCGTSSSKNRGDLVDLVFSWSIDDIFNEDLYKHQVKSNFLNFSLCNY